MPTALHDLYIKGWDLHHTTPPIKSPPFLAPLPVATKEKSSSGEQVRMGSMGIGGLILLVLITTGVSLAAPAHTAYPVVDLGYASYQGYYDSTYHLNVYKG